MQNKEHVILVNEKDEPTGTMEKMEAHEKGLLHRAFSIFVFNDKNELMLQQRAKNKYHSGGLWTNTCCSHQQAGESNLEAGKRRLLEEMGFQTDLFDAFYFIYKSPMDRGLTEHELDHVLIGYYNGEPRINPAEAASWKWQSMDSIKADLPRQPERYTEWFKICFSQVWNFLNKKQNTAPS